VTSLWISSASPKYLKDRDWLKINSSEASTSGSNPNRLVADSYGNLADYDGFDEKFGWAFCPRSICSAGQNGIVSSRALILDQKCSVKIAKTSNSGSLFLLALTTVRLPFKVWVYLAIVLTIGIVISALLRDPSIALLSVLRLLAIALPAPLLASTTAPSDLVRALQAVRLPGFLVLSIMLIWRFMPLMQQEVQRIIEANQLRGVNLARQPRQWFPGLLLPLIFRMVSYADEVTIGLETRGYDPIAPRSNSDPLKWRSADTLFAVGALVLLGTVGYIEWIA
jgi:energy-coupling factor transport system permease protein